MLTSCLAQDIWSPLVLEVQEAVLQDASTGAEGLISSQAFDRHDVASKLWKLITPTLIQKSGSTVLLVAQTKTILIH